MFRDKLNKIIGSKDSKPDGKDGRKIENLVVFAIILIITIIVINVIWNGDERKSTKDTTKDYSKKLASNTTTEETSEVCESSDLEKKLENILSKIQGVGKVKVFINYSQSSETVAMYNENSKTSTTEETDTSGGTRKVEQTDSDKEIVYQEENGKKTPILQKTLQPKIEGAIITAKGASNVNVKTNIIQAVEAATGLATHKIQVFEME